MMRDQAPTAALPVDLARDALEQMSEEQRLALVFEIVNQTVQTGSVFHLIRLERVARDAAEQLTQVKFINEEAARCR